MRDWHHDRRTDIGLRLGGAVLGGGAWFAVRELAARHLSASHGDPGIGVLFLAAVAFLGASLGVMFVTQGHHIFDPVEIGERWRTVRLPPEAAVRSGASLLPEMRDAGEVLHDRSERFVDGDVGGGHTSGRRT
jgi:hypothetical protein